MMYESKLRFWLESVGDIDGSRRTRSRYECSNMGMLFHIFGSIRYTTGCLQTFWPEARVM